MDELDHKILRLMAKNARMPVKEIAQQVNLTSPAVSSRIHRLEEAGIIGGYTVVLHPPEAQHRIRALISVSTVPASRDEFTHMVENESQVLRCYRVTGSYNFIVMADCADVDALEHLISHIQKYGTTNTQIILATQVDRPMME